MTVFFINILLYMSLRHKNFISQNQPNYVVMIKAQHDLMSIGMKSYLVTPRGSI